MPLIRCYWPVRQAGPSSWGMTSLSWSRSPSGLSHTLPTDCISKFIRVRHGHGTCTVCRMLHPRTNAATMLPRLYSFEESENHKKATRVVLGSHPMFALCSNNAATIIQFQNLKTIKRQQGESLEVPRCSLSAATVLPHKITTKTCFNSSIL